jgi:DegV family protein with EDD domain
MHLDSGAVICYIHIEIFRCEVTALTKHHDNAKIFMAFCDVTRLKVLEFLRRGDKSATELREFTGAGQSTLSHHMKILTDSGIVAAKKSGKWTYYTINETNGRYAARLLRLLTSGNGEIFETMNRRRKNDMKPFTIIVDTSCDLPPEYLKEHGIETIAIPFMLDGTEHKNGYWQDISDKEFYKTLRDGGTAKTSQINPEAFVKSFTEYAKQDKDALYIILSSGLSATYQSSQIALEEVKESYPGCQIYPVDSLGATVLNNILAIMAVRKREEGLSAEETAAWLNEKRHRIFGFFTVDDLMYLHRGGRLSKLSAIGGSLLGIKPVLTIKPDGMLALKEKIRGREAAYELMINQIKRSTAPGTVPENVYISHTDCYDDAFTLSEMVKAAIGIQNVHICTMGPVIGAHTGPGAVTLVYEADMTREEYERLAAR